MEPNNEDVAAVVAAAAAVEGGGGEDISGHDFGGHDDAAAANEDTNLLPADPEADANDDINNDEEEDNENEEPEADADGRDDDNDDIDEIADDEEEEDAADGEDEEDDRMAIQKLLSVLQQREDFPLRQRNKIIELAHQFVINLGYDIKDMVTDQRPVADGYAGLDSNRDTQQEVETALRHYPETLAERGGDYNRLNWYPIQCITTICDRANRNFNWVCNPMAVSFVVLFAKLAIELNLFADEERGGLLATVRVGSDNTLRRLVGSSRRSRNKDYHQLIDTQFLEVLIQLQRSGLFKKEDIQQYELVHELCRQAGYFAEQRFHFLTNWDPSSLLQLGDQGELPLFWGFATHTIRQFQVMVDCYFQYYTKERVICCLFQKDSDGDTPFQLACKYLHKHKTDTLVHDVVEQSLGTARFSSPTATSSSSSSSSSLNIGTMLMMATRNNNISLDGWYYFIRKQPDKLLSMLRHRRRCDDIVSPILSSSSSRNHNTGTNGRITGIRHSSNTNTNTNTRINDDGTSIDQKNSNNTNNDDTTTSHNNNSNNNNNNNVVVRRRTTRKRKQLS